jgi:glucoamylase
LFQAQYFSTFHASEQLFDALMTWDLLGELQITELSLKFFRQFNRDVKTGTYKKGSEVYEVMTYALTSWAEKALLFLAEHTPEDYVVTMAIDRATGLPVGPRGTVHSVVSAISVYDAYNGLIPPSWVHGASGRSSMHPWNDTPNSNYNVGFGGQAGSGSQFHVEFQV